MFQPTLELSMKNTNYILFNLKRFLAFDVGSKQDPCELKSYD